MENQTDVDALSFLIILEKQNLRNTHTYYQKCENCMKHNVKNQQTKFTSRINGFHC